MSCHQRNPKCSFRESKHLKVKTSEAWRIEDLVNIKTINYTPESLHWGSAKVIQVSEWQTVNIKPRLPGQSETTYTMCHTAIASGQNGTLNWANDWSNYQRDGLVHTDQCTGPHSICVRVCGPLDGKYIYLLFGLKLCRV